MLFGILAQAFWFTEYQIKQHTLSPCLSSNVSWLAVAHVCLILPAFCLCIAASMA